MHSIEYYSRLIQIFKSYKLKEAKLSYMPLRIWLEPTNHCNLKCIMCPNHNLSKNEKGYMDFSLYTKIIDELTKFDPIIYLHHRGESLLHPAFFSMAKYAKDRNLFLILHTNGTLLNEKKAYQLIDSGIDRVIFSFDGFKKETYEKIRINGNFDKTLANIIQFLIIKKKTGTKKPYVALEIINFSRKNNPQDEVEKKKFLDKFKGLPLNKIQKRNLHNWGGEFTLKKGKKFPLSSCPFPWISLVILWDGNVLPCTQDFYGKLVLGNVSNDSLEKIWNNEKMIRLRKEMIDPKNINIDICKNCDRLWREQILGIPKEYLEKLILKKLY